MANDEYTEDKPDFTSADIKMYDRDGNETTREKMQVKRGAVLNNQGQRREEINGKLTIENVRWLDEERTLVQARYFDSEGWGRVENHAANASGPGTFFSKILQQYTIDDIDEDINDIVENIPDDFDWINEDITEIPDFYIPEEEFTIPFEKLKMRPLKNINSLKTGKTLVEYLTVKSMKTN